MTEPQGVRLGYNKWHSSLMKLEGGREGEDQKIRRLGRNLRGCVSQSSVRRTHPPGGQGISQVPWPVVQSVGTGSPRAPYGFFSSNREQQTFRKNVTSMKQTDPCDLPSPDFTHLIYYGSHRG